MGGVWTEQAKLEAVDGDSEDRFGYSVALSGDTVVVGAPFDEDGGSEAGAAYVFGWTGTSWLQTQKIVATDAENFDVFGWACSLDHDGNLVIGNHEGAYLLVRHGASVVEKARLRQSVGCCGSFGKAVSIDGGLAVVGAATEDLPGRVNAGAGYTFDVRTPGSVYCSPAVPNSTGMFGRMVLFGSDVVAENSLSLAAIDLPVSANVGHFIMGTGTQSFVPPGSVGSICVAPGIKRYLPVQSTSEHPGGFSRTVGTRGPVSSYVTAGSTWNFQAWHRDAASGTSNLTDAVSVSFQ